MYLKFIKNSKHEFKKSYLKIQNGDSNLLFLSTLKFINNKANNYL